MRTLLLALSLATVPFAQSRGDDELVHGRTLRAWVAELEAPLAEDFGRVRRVQALRAIALSGTEAPELAAALVAQLDPLLDGVAGEVQEWCIYSLQREARLGLAAMGSVAVPPLTDALVEGSAQLRAGAAWALSDLGQIAAPALPELERQLENDAQPLARIAAAVAIARIEGGAADMAAIVGTHVGAYARKQDYEGEWLQSPYFESQAALVALATLGPDARAELEHLAELPEWERFAPLKAAARARVAESEEARAEVVEIIAEKPGTTAVIHALWVLDGDLLEPLAEGLEETDDSEERSAFADAFAKLGLVSIRTTRALLEDPTPEVAAALVDGLRFEGAAFLPVFERALYAPLDEDGRKRLGWAFVRLTDRVGLDAVLEALGDRDTTAQLNAATCAWHLAAQRADPVPKAWSKVERALKKLGRSRDDAVEAMAEKALAELAQPLER